VAGAATAAVAAQNLALESGIGSRTVAQWVHRIRAGEGLSGVDVLVLDEANLTDDRDRAALYQAAGRSGTKLVEVGDPQQLRGVGCGSLFARVHQLVGGMELTENRRQASEDERAAIAAWRDGRYTQALSSWAGRGRLVATETGEQAVTAMVASWMGQRAGAPDAHAEMRGVVMLAAANDTVERLNDAAQAVPAAAGELGPERLFEVKGGRSLRLRAGDHVLVRLNDRAQRMHEGPDVLNGYRGIVEHIDSRPGSSGADGAVRVAWQQHGPDGPVTHRATLSAEFVGAGGLSLGYAMTGHKAEGLTVTADWALPGGTRQGGTVLVHAAGMDEPGLHVATSRHRDKVILFAGRDQLETPGDTHELGIPTTGQQLERRVVAALAEQARTRPGTANDTPVHDDLGRGAGRAPDRTPGRGADLDPLPRAVEQSDLADAWAELRRRHWPRTSHWSNCGRRGASRLAPPSSSPPSNHGWPLPAPTPPASGAPSRCSRRCATSWKRPGPPSTQQSRQQAPPSRPWPAGRGRSPPNCPRRGNSSGQLPARRRTGYRPAPDAWGYAAVRSAPLRPSWTVGRTPGARCSARPGWRPTR